MSCMLVTHMEKHACSRRTARSLYAHRASSPLLSNRRGHVKCTYAIERTYARQEKYSSCHDVALYTSSIKQDAKHWHSRNPGIASSLAVCSLGSAGEYQLHEQRPTAKNTILPPIKAKRRSKYRTESCTGVKTKNNYQNTNCK